MNTSGILILGSILGILFFSSGISALSDSYLDSLKKKSGKKGWAGHISHTMLKIILLLSGIRQAWIRVITPGNEADKK